MSVVYASYGYEGFHAFLKCFFKTKMVQNNKNNFIYSKTSYLAKMISNNKLHRIHRDALKGFERGVVI